MSIDLKFRWWRKKKCFGTIRSGTIRKICLGLACSLVWSSSAFSAMRMWEDKQGHRFEAEYVKELFGSVFMKDANNHSIDIDVKDLSDADVQYIRTAFPPEISVNVIKDSKNKKRNKYARLREDRKIITLRVSIDKESNAPFNGKLTAEIYLIGKEVATDDFRLILKKAADVKFTDENHGECQFEITGETRAYTEYNNQERGDVYAGYIVLVFDPQGNQISLSTNFQWVQENKVNPLRNLQSGDFFDKEFNETPVPRPDYYIGRAITF